MSQSKSKSPSNLIKCRGLGIRYSRMFFVTKENFPAYIQACKRNQVWSGATEIEESIEDHIVKQDVRISLYLRKIEIRLHPDNQDVIQVAIKSRLSSSGHTSTSVCHSCTQHPSQSL